MLLRHMPEAEALRFLHDVVDVPQLESKLKRDFLGTEMLEEVAPFCRVFVHAVEHDHVDTFARLLAHTLNCRWICVNSGMRSSFSRNTSHKEV